MIYLFGGVVAAFLALVMVYCAYEIRDAILWVVDDKDGETP